MKDKKTKTCNVCGERFEAFDKKEVCSSRCFHRINSCKKFGISVYQYRKMLDDQAGCCAICGKEFEQLANINIDHDHSDGAVRGLLCKNCNLMVGNAKDNPITLARAIQYLEVAEERRPSVQKMKDASDFVWEARVGIDASKDE